MKERRSLIDGLAATAELKDLEEAFVFGSRNKTDTVAEPVQVQTQTEVSQIAETVHIANEPMQPKVLPHMTGRIPVTTRCRPEVATALKRASLQRQLNGIEPFYVQDIMEEALETWLRNNGYVS